LKLVQPSPAGEPDVLSLRGVFRAMRWLSTVIERVAYGAVSSRDDTTLDPREPGFAGLDQRRRTSYPGTDRAPSRA
jgi:hypothetical protein